MKKELSVVVPAYNEADRIGRTLKETAAFFRGAGYAFEILVVNDGSTDRTAEIVRECAREFSEIRLIDRPANRGKGETVKEGIREARYPYCLFMDADNATRAAEWPKFEEKFRAGARAVSASRHLPDSKIVHPQPFTRRFLGGGYRALCRALFGLRATDFNCGFKAYETELAQRVYAQANRRDWTFDVEVLCLMRREGVRPEEVPVTWSHHPKAWHTPALRTAVGALGSLAALKQRFG